MKHVFLIMCLIGIGCDSRSSQNQVAPKPIVPSRNGIGVIVMVDHSGSMKDSVRDVDGVSRPKQDISHRAIMSLIERCEKYANNNPTTFELSIFKFDSHVKVVVPFAKPNSVASKLAVDTIQPDGGTAIGDALVEARNAIDGTGLSTRHVILITDGENNEGISPADAVQQLAGSGVNVYIVAFDVNSDSFKVFKNAGWTVLSASNGNQLQTGLDQLLGENILLEK